MNIENYNIQIRTLIRIYKQFKSNPNKVFVAKDINKDYNHIFIQRYFGTLIRLGIIKKVDAIYYTGKKYRIRRDVVGYKLVDRKVFKE